MICASLADRVAPIRRRVSAACNDTDRPGGKPSGKTDGGDLVLRISRLGGAIGQD
ncbi:MAG: hypothetical protein JXO72_04760 [Vicinamibacteria bacterium]|nr:hypothetical protein [Vicinamibacteria bacterium]